MEPWAGLWTLVTILFSPLTLLLGLSVLTLLLPLPRLPFSFLPIPLLLCVPLLSIPLLPLSLPLHPLTPIPVCSPPPHSPPTSVRSHSPSPVRGRGRAHGRGGDSSPFPELPASPGRGHGRGRGRRRGRGGNDSSSPDSSASPGRGRSRGRGHGRDGDGSSSDSSTGRVRRHGRPKPPVTFPNCIYSFSRSPHFIGVDPGPTFLMRDHDNATAYTYFSLFFDDQLLQHIVDQTNLHASQCPYHRVNYQWFDTSVDEMRSFLGILVVVTDRIVPPGKWPYLHVTRTLVTILSFGSGNG